MVAGLGGHRLPGLQRDVRRVADHDVDRAGQVVEGVGHVAVPQVDAGAGEVALGPGVGAPRRARRRAPGRRAPRRRPRGRSRPSRCRGRPRPAARASRRTASIAQPASSSVSGRGTNTPGPTTSSTWRKCGGAGEVLQRLAGRAARDQRVVRSRLRRATRRRPATSRREVDAEHVGEQLGRRRAPGDATPAAASRSAAARQRTRGARSLLERLEPGGQVGLDARLR